jgi:hypothetical protein
VVVIETRYMNLPMILQPFQCNDLIRLGKNGDGGYLVNIEDVKKSTKLISFGVSTDWSFEEDFSKINDCPCVAYDHSVKDDIPFFSGKNSLIRKQVGTEVFLSEILKPDDMNVFLKCDIEGDEYKILHETIQHSHRFSGIIIEFHDMSKYPLFNQLTSFISKIQQKLIHNHPNTYRHVKFGENQYSPDVLELSFTSSKNIFLNPNLSLPHKLDQSNCFEENNFVISF